MSGAEPTPKPAAGGCGAPAGDVPPAAGTRRTVVQGRVTRNGTAVSTGYARLLDHDGEFVAEVPLSDDGQYRFFPVPGRWTLRVLAPGVRAERRVTAVGGEVTEVPVAI